MEKKSTDYIITVHTVGGAKFTRRITDQQMADFIIKEPNEFIRTIEPNTYIFAIDYVTYAPVSDWKADSDPIARFP